MVDSATSATSVREDVALRVTIEIPSWERVAAATQWVVTAGWMAYALGAGVREWWRGRR